MHASGLSSAKILFARFERFQTLLVLFSAYVVYNLNGDEVFTFQKLVLLQDKDKKGFNIVA